MVVLLGEDPTFECSLSVGELSTEDRLDDLFPQGGPQAREAFFDLWSTPAAIRTPDLSNTMTGVHHLGAVSTSTASAAASSASLATLQDHQEYHACCLGEKRSVEAAYGPKFPEGFGFHEGFGFPFSTIGQGGTVEKKASKHYAERPSTPKNSIVGPDGSPGASLAGESEAHLVTPPKKKSKLHDVAKDIGMAISEALISSSHGQGHDFQQALFERVMQFKDVLLGPKQESKHHQEDRAQDETEEDIDLSDLKPLPVALDVPQLYGNEGLPHSVLLPPPPAVAPTRHREPTFIHPPLPADPVGEYEEYEIPLSPTMIPPGTVITLQDAQGVERKYHVNYYCFWGTPEEAIALKDSFPEGSITSIDAPPPIEDPPLDEDDFDMASPYARLQHDTEDEEDATPYGWVPPCPV